MAKKAKETATAEEVKETPVQEENVAGTTENKTSETASETISDAPAETPADPIAEAPADKSEEEQPKEDPVKSDADLVNENPNAEIRSLKGAQAWLDKDYIFLNSAWHWIPNSRAWEFVKLRNANARGQKNYVSPAELNPLGKQLEV